MLTPEDYSDLLLEQTEGPTPNIKIERLATPGSGVTGETKKNPEKESKFVVSDAVRQTVKDAVLYAQGLMD